ncbi:NitT/TauT family transport system substrate-binding protein [Caldalkalibacillus uzonensis]|uniref:NitT/TauT family transport system substrate-binding protein n=1 Tax=Caldalkalibacillus uzonensis TaxID=353224 RepID=A0ABU0CTV5_9BACI|nr:ABC transporter substrate-binding protein [Caldalkalibacillus uzonensis]MDQ0339849.1 NitT/TauT family transport system substrate-binding protein [Caldalkalibacillus uzonensis]
MKKLSITMILFISLSVILSGCFAAQEDIKTVRVAEVTRSIFYAPQYVALTQGFFEEEGLKVELTTTWGGDKTMTTLLSDGADIALVGSETSIYVYQQGSEDPVINFAQLTQTDGTFLVSREKIEDFSWDDLKGSVFLGQRKGGMPQMVGEYVLKKHGIDPQRDLELIQNVDFGNIPNAFASGTGEFVQLFEPQATIFEMEGIGHVVASFGVESGHVPYTSYMAKQSYITKNEEVIQRFTNALYRAQQWVYEQPSEEVAKVIAPFFEDTDHDVLVQVIDRYKEQKSFKPDPLLEKSHWELLQDIIEEAGELKERVDYEVLVNSTFAERAKGQ